MNNNAVNNASLQIISKHGFAEIIQNNLTGQKSLHALIPFKAGDLLCRFEAGEIFNTPNYLTVQRGIAEHITLLPEFLQYINHSCSPNVFFNTSSMELFALKEIAANEEINFFYPSTEENMAQPFLCYCGSKNCLQNIRGAADLPAEILNQYRLTDFIQQQLLQKIQADS